MSLKGLIIRKPWIDLILAGQKTWEMRSKGTSVRGPIALIEKGSGTVVGLADLQGSLPPLQPNDMPAHFEKHQVPQRDVVQPGFNWLTPWVITNARRLDRPMPYRHKPGAVIWVELDPEVEAAVLGKAGHTSSARAAKTPTSLSAQHSQLAKRAIRDLAGGVQVPPEASTTMTRRGNKLYIDVEWDDGLPDRRNRSSWRQWTDVIGIFAALVAMICMIGFVIHFALGMMSSSISALSAFKWLIPMCVAALLATVLGQGHLLQDASRQ